MYPIPLLFCFACDHCEIDLSGHCTIFLFTTP